MRKYLSVSPVVRLAFFLAIFAASCTTQKNTNLFQTIPYNSEIQTLISKDFEHRVKPDDILLIGIFSNSPEVKDYNTSGTDGYLVDKFGNIQMYKFGDVKVQGLTLTQVKEKIAKLLVPDYFKQASVSVRFKNHRVLVLGDIGSPGLIPMETEHISLLEAIAARGDLRETAKKDNILIIRNTDKGKMFYRVSLLDGSIFNSPYYYLQSEDIVYVEGDPKKKQPNQTGVIIGYALSVVSILLLVVDRF